MTSPLTCCFATGRWGPLPPTQEHPHGQLHPDRSCRRFEPLSLPPCSRSEQLHAPGQPTPCQYSLMPQSSSWCLGAALCHAHGGCATLLHAAEPEQQRVAGQGHEQHRSSGGDSNSDAASAPAGPSLLHASLGWGGRLLGVTGDGSVTCAQLAGARCDSSLQAWQWEAVRPPSSSDMVQAALGEEVGLVLDAAGVAWQLEGWQGSGSSRSSNSQQEPPNEAEAGVTGKGDRDRQYAATGTEAAKPAAKTRRLTAPDDGRALLGPRDIGLALTQVPFEHCVKIVQVCCGAQHCLAVSAPAPAAGFPSGGLAFSWGWNGLGAAGQGSQLQVPSPKLVEALAGAVCVAQAAAGLSHTLLLSDLGDVYSCGWNGDGQLGLGDRSLRLEPTLVDHLTEPIQKVSCGGRHSLALGRCGRRLSAWGWGAWGQLGLGQDTEAKQLPQQVHVPGVSTCGASTQGPGLCIEAIGPEGDKGPAGCSNGGELAAPEEKAGVILDVEGGRWHTLLLRT